jgi:hypothetical protein
MMRIFLIIGLVFWSVFSHAASLRIEGDRAWLKAEGTPLVQVLQLFEERGVEVLVDPSMDLGRVEGEWENAKVERLISQLVSPNSYSVEWKLIKGPLGEFYQVSVIRVYSESAASATSMTSKKARVLDVVEGRDGQKYVRGEIMVGFREGSTTKDLNTLLKELNGTVIEVIDPPGLYRIKLNEGMSVEKALEMAENHEGVEGAEPNLAFSGEANPAVSLSGSSTGMNLNLKQGETAVAVFDSGLDPNYANLPYIRGSYNALDPAANMDDPSGHGTLVSLIASGAITPIGAEASETGVPVLAVKVFDENGMTSSDTIMRAIDYALNSDISVINLSFGTYEDVGFIENAVEYAASQGVKIFVAAGNDGLDIASNPAASPATVSVGATDGGAVADYSNTAADVFYPGSAILDGKTHKGTSFSSPWAAYLYATLPEQ